jgi:IS30 family transposase
MRDWHQVDVAAGIDSDLAVHPEAELDRVAAELNDRPRRRLGFRKPVEEMADRLLAA